MESALGVFKSVVNTDTSRLSSGEEALHTLLVKMGFGGTSKLGAFQSGAAAEDYSAAALGIIDALLAKGSARMSMRPSSASFSPEVFIFDFRFFL